MSVKTALKRLLPAAWLDSYRRVQRAREKKRNAAKTTEQVFTEIYAEKKWAPGSKEFDSGVGSSDERITNAYLRAVRDWLDRIGSINLTIVDLGCGDFRVGQQLIDLCGHYVGVDIVKPLIERLVKNFGSTKAEFLHRNILEDGLPDGDICFLRQVLQHLSNDQIQTIIRHVQRYRWTVITEHYPSPAFFRAPNLDKPHGADIRLFDGSGVFLQEPPFNVPRERLELLLEVAGHPFPGWPDPGVIRTYLLAGP
jgi:methyltransferase family protein